MIRVTATRLLRYNISTKRSIRKPIVKRPLVTAAQKRALNKTQLSGGKEDGSAKIASSVGAESTPQTPLDGGGSGGGGVLLPVLALAVTTAGGSYYMDLIPNNLLPAALQKEKIEKIPSTPKHPENETKAITVVKEVVPKEEKKAGNGVGKKLATETSAKQKDKDVKVLKRKKKVEDKVVHRVTQIQAPPKDTKRIVSPPPPVQHAADAHKVTVENFETVYSTATEEKGKKATATVNDSEVELILEEGKSKTDIELVQAHLAIRANLDETLLKDLNNLSDIQLRVRVVQLASELQDRTKWEAVRLKEFLLMKEKEVNERHIEKIQKQRLEFEDFLAKRLREQEDRLFKEANAKIQAKEESFQAIIDAAAETQKAANEATMKSTTDRLQREISAKAEAEFATKLAEEKAVFAQELEQKAAAVKNIVGKMKKVEDLMKIRRNFEDGSQRAHRVSAAALAFAEKMETSKSAAEELAALKVAAFESGVIEAALTKIPDSVKTGVPTLPELQTSYESSYVAGRQAAHVPVGRNGLEGQLIGMFFSMMTSPPSPDSVPPASDSGLTDHILSSASRHIQLGNLEEAVSELDKLKGQTALTMRDWKKTATDRIAVDKIMKVIKMECALMNKNMGG